MIERNSTTGATFHIVLLIPSDSRPTSDHLFPRQNALPKVLSMLDPFAKLDGRPQCVHRMKAGCTRQRALWLNSKPNADTSIDLSN